ncbi:OmpA family protein [Roseococcus sp. DSY-14]|uniref:OmpA family protein n=1 Tax=Roseococcus sp. DSY-14 TaxID=3369650 RepID=UPI00387B3D1D
MSLKKALLAATVLSLPVAAQAQPITGLYIGAGAGANYRVENDNNLPAGPRQLAANAGLQQNGKVETNWGYVGVGSIGWGFGNGIRAEIEGNYRNNSVDTVTLSGRQAFSAGGTIHQYGVMANALYDFNQFNLAGFVPYVGVGAGYVWTDFRNVRGASAFPGRTGSIRIDDRDGRFAYQGIAGVAYNLSSVAPGLAVTAEYRFLGTLENKLDGRGTLTGAGGGTGPIRAEGESYNHSILLGLRYAFNAPRPAPVVAVAPAAAPAPARTYLVFFDWDRADLTDRARQIIAEAAQNAQRVGSTRIEVSGHADRTGTAQYNQRLSVRRAEAVAAELGRRGIARNQITVQGFGFDRPLVPTAQGVREPQNRRVEIVLR